MLTKITPKNTSLKRHKHQRAKHLSKDIPSSLLPWLTSIGSLTALLEARAGQPLKVERKFEGYRPMSLSLKKQMGYTGSQLNRPVLAWVREVWLFGSDDEPWIAAQSVFPIPSLQGDAKRLRHIRDTPIGYVVFKRQAKLPNQRFIQQTNSGWQRQTLYYWHNRPLLISETFLSTFKAE